MSPREEREIRYRCAVLQGLVARPDTRPFGRDNEGNAIVTARGELLCHEAYGLARKMIEIEEAEEAEETEEVEETEETEEADDQTGKG